MIHYFCSYNKEISIFFLPWAEIVFPSTNKTELLVYGNESYRSVVGDMDEPGIIIAYFSSGLITADPRIMGYGNG